MRASSIGFLSAKVPIRNLQFEAVDDLGMIRQSRIMFTRFILYAPLALAACGNAAQIEGARSGQTVKLSGNQGVITLRNKTWSPALTIDAANATFTGIVLDHVKGLHLKGGTVIGPGGHSYGIRVLASQNIDISGMTLTGAHRGIVVDRSQDLVISDNNFTGLISDGLDIASSQRLRVERNTCSKFNPKLATFASDGTKKDGDHPDCIQGWSNNNQPMTTDVKIIGNRVDGIMQGIFIADFDRLEIRDNVLRVGMGNAISVGNGSGFVIENNDVSSIPGLVHQRNNSPVRANITVRVGALGTACGNIIRDVPNNSAAKSCSHK